MNKVDALKSCYLCRELGDDEMSALAAVASLRHVRKGTMLFVEGDSADGFYALVDGRVRVYKSSPDGREYTIHVIHPGQTFAEATAFGDHNYPANCSAIEDSTIAFFATEKFLNLLRISPEISLKIMASLSGFLREYNRLVEELSLKDVQARLASHLLEEYRSTPGEVIYLRISKTELAKSLGTVSETLSRNFKKLAEMGVIEVNGNEIRVLDPERLQILTQ
jgi:CRP-like cAMP-binding protein